MKKLNVFFDTLPDDAQDDVQGVARADVGDDVQGDAQGVARADVGDDVQADEPMKSMLEPAAPIVVIPMPAVPVVVDKVRVDEVQLERIPADEVRAEEVLTAQAPVVVFPAAESLAIETPVVVLPVLNEPAAALPIAKPPSPVPPITVRPAAKPPEAEAPLDLEGILPVELASVEVVSVDIKSLDVKPVELPTHPTGFKMPAERARDKRHREKKKATEDHEAFDVSPKKQKVRKPLPGSAQLTSFLRGFTSLARTRRAFIPILIGVVVILVAVIVLSQLYSFRTVADQTMDETLKQNEVVVVSKNAYKKSPPQYGDIVIYMAPSVSDSSIEKPAIGRIIGIPGDRISIWDGKVYLNDVRMDEPYVKGGITSSRLNEVVVQEGTYFIMGDNRVASRDSRNKEVGLIPGSKIVGKVILRISPYTKF